jgi:hypothetical protein
VLKTSVPDGSTVDLSGATFQLYGADHTAVGDPVVTGPDGTAIICGVVDGDYVTEVSAPDGYINQGKSETLPEECSSEVEDVAGVTADVAELPKYVCTFEDPAATPTPTPTATPEPTPTPTPYIPTPTPQPQCVTRPWTCATPTPTPYIPTPTPFIATPTPVVTPAVTPNGAVAGATGKPSLPPTSEIPGQGGGPNGTLPLLLVALGAASLALISATTLRKRILDRVDR